MFYRVSQWLSPHYAYTVCVVRQCHATYQSRNNVCDMVKVLQSKQYDATNLCQLWHSKHYVAMYCW